MVAPFTGAWIEMTATTRRTSGMARVAPFTGAWIEIIIGVVDEVHEMQEVAPFTGAWIEMRQC